MKPSSSTIGSGIGGAIVVVLVWVLKEFYGITIPPEVSLNFGIILTFLAGYVGDIVDRLIFQSRVKTKEDMIQNILRSNSLLTGLNTSAVSQKEKE